MKRTACICCLTGALLGACASDPDKRTLATLAAVEPDIAEVAIEDSLDKAMSSYRRFLLETPESAMTPEAMRRLADLHIEKEYGIAGRQKAGGPPEAATAAAEAAGTQSARLEAIDESLVPQRHTGAERVADHSEAETAFEKRTTLAETFVDEHAVDLEMPEGVADRSGSGPAEALLMYQQILETYPLYERNDQVLYQMARAHDELGQPDEAMAVAERLIREYPHSRYLDEVSFRRAEYFFVRKRYLDAEEAYAAVVAYGPHSDFYELALYKLGWTFYKQELYEEALTRFVDLLDHKLIIGYDFDQTHEEEDERRVADTFRVISLAFSNLGGPEVLGEYFARYGNRSYEDRIYSNLGEFYLTKLRYQDAATVYESFVAQNPFHKVSPHFSMRVTEIYGEGGFPKLVVESKKAFARLYGIDAEYWKHFDLAEADDVRQYLKTNLKDLANHYHALYQDEGLAEEQLANYGEASQWYREYLASFPEDPETPSINHQLADLLLEHEDFGAAATEYERTAYDYPVHEKSDAAGYAAVFAHRKHLETVTGAEHLAVREKTVVSSLRFSETFPAHERAATVLSAAAEDLYDMEEFEQAIDAGRTLIERHADAEADLRRSAWAVVAHSSFDLGRYPDAELAYVRVLDLTPQQDRSRQALFDNLAAAIYKQGEQANALEDYRGAAGHFLRIKAAAPTSEIRAAAEYDASVALIKIEDWGAAAEVLRGFRTDHAGHALQEQVTRQLAFVYQEAGDPGRSAEEYERVADDATEPELEREALLLAGRLYEDAGEPMRALGVYQRYVSAHSRPVDAAVEARFRIAEIHRTSGDTAAHHQALRRIVEFDATAGVERTDRSRYLAARAALVLAGPVYERFTELRLMQPFEKSLAEKQRRMDAALAAYENLVTYEVAEVVAAATFYIAEIYGHFSQALQASERPADLTPQDMNDYELALEEEAFPFEERAIEVHERNVELMLAGTFNTWIEQSIGRLAVLMPGRYAKAEVSSGYVGTVETYAYRSPRAEAMEAGETGAVSARPAPRPADAAAALAEDKAAKAAGGSHASAVL